ncbi:MAG: hypothetical protein E7319_02010 [Clostridiales bacterium]|nr:hypothetical protein [Clostridiales bacterium]
MSGRKKPKQPYRSMLAERLFSAAETSCITEYLTEVRARLNLNRKHTKQLMDDHVLALKLLRDRGLSLEEAMARLAPERLGHFYLEERKDWYPLDHAAKIYPLSMSTRRMKVFRLSCYLKEPVIPELLQMALTYTMRRFPSFATTIKCGFFWHYLDSGMCRYAVRPETKLPCAVMKVGAVHSPSLRVVYYQNRISVEFFHILTDGTGGCIYLRTLVKTYLELLGAELPDLDSAFSLDDTPDPAEWEDAFPVSGKGPAHGFADKPALQMKGMLPLEQPNRVLHYNLSTKALLDAAHRYGGTMTGLLLGLCMLACRDACHISRYSRKKIQIQLPVNMRKFFPVKTLRNFSMYTSIRLHPSQITTLEEMIPDIMAQIREGTAQERLEETMRLSCRLVKWLRFVPLIIKRPIAYFIYGKLGDGVFTTTLSNLGSISLPAEMQPYVDKFDFVLGPPVENRANCSVCSFGDQTVLTVVKNTHLTQFEDSLYRYLCDIGLTPYMEGSG